MAAALAAGCCALIWAGGCQDPRRDAIAREPGSAAPFTFPYVDPSIPDAPSRFSGAAGTASGAPTIAYPLDGAMHAMNIGAVTFQWTRGHEANRVFRIRLDDGAEEYDFYIPCNAGRCMYTLPPRGWLSVASSHPDGQLTATVAGTDGRGGPVYLSAAIVVRFSPAPVTGGLYYWTATSVGGTTYRLPFGATTATPFIVPSSATNPLPCSGCHSVSRDGRMISFAAAADAASFNSYLAVASTHTPEQATIVPDMAAGRNARFTAISSSGNRALVTYFGRIAVFDAQTGAPVDIGDTEALMPPGRLVTHPEWSPSSNRVAFTLYGAEQPSDARPEDGEIVTLDLDPVTGRATRLRRVLVVNESDGMHHFYPTWSPDERWLVVAAAPRGTSAYVALTARLRLVSAEIDDQICPGPTCYDLGQASQGTDVSSTWPKLSPFSQGDGRLFFVTFSSRIDYGFLLPNRGAGGAGRAQLWMSAIDLRAVAAGGDPSLPPVWLPFQDVTQINHLPFWSAIVACSEDGTSYPACGEGEVCDRGECRVKGP